ncbi:STM2901 family protein [Paraburkholderia sp. JPY419]|uniref:STM2901 family protein n=1 Tax=Paraburkholderia sp. JPY419 TaxID=667660 RepID=UPI003D210966
MNEYEQLISNDSTKKINTYIHGGRAVDNETLFICIATEEACKHFGIKDYSGVLAIVLVLAGQPLIPTRAKPMGTTRGTSIASLVLRALVNVNFKEAILPTLTNQSMKNFRFSLTRNLGAFVGRWIPQLGITLAAYDVIRIAASSVMHYNKLVRNEDRINDATTGSFG